MYDWFVDLIIKNYYTNKSFKYQWYIDDLGRKISRLDKVEPVHVSLVFLGQLISNYQHPHYNDRISTLGKVEIERQFLHAQLSYSIIFFGLHNMYFWTLMTSKKNSFRHQIRKAHMWNNAHQYKKRSPFTFYGTANNLSIANNLLSKNNAQKYFIFWFGVFIIGHNTYILENILLRS